MSWEKKTLDQLGSVARGKSKHRPRNDERLFGGEYPFIQTADVKESGLYLTNYSQTYNEFGLEQSKLWPAGTLCITIAANIAETAILGMDACFPDSIMGFLPFEGVSDVRYIKYCFNLLQRECKQISQGTTQDNLSWEKLSTITFLVPPYDQQVKIADIISTYDDLIENNKNQIKLLEEAAQRLYKEWFVDLHFPGYENTKIINGEPEGWHQKLISDCLNVYLGGGWGTEIATGKNIYLGKVIRGTDINKIKVGDFKDLPIRYHTENDRKKKSLRINDIVFEISNGNINNIGRSLLIDEFILEKSGKFSICASFCKLLRPKNRLLALIIYWGIQDMQKSGNLLAFKRQGSNGINNFSFEAFLNYRVYIPEDIKMVEPLENITQMIGLSRKKVSLLSEVRDRLLTKLMNGEVEF